MKYLTIILYIFIVILFLKHFVFSTSVFILIDEEINLNKTKKHIDNIK